MTFPKVRTEVYETSDGKIHTKKHIADAHEVSLGMAALVNYAVHEATLRYNSCYGADRASSITRYNSPGYRQMLVSELIQRGITLA